MRFGQERSSWDRRSLQRTIAGPRGSFGGLWLSPQAYCLQFLSHTPTIWAAPFAFSCTFPYVHLSPGIAFLLSHHCYFYHFFLSAVRTVRPESPHVVRMARTKKTSSRQFTPIHALHNPLFSMPKRTILWKLRLGMKDRKKLQSVLLW